MGREWELGKDVHEQDNLLDGLTFDCLIVAVSCNCKVIDEDSVRQTVKEMFDANAQDMNDLLDKNIGEIIKRAKKGRD